MTKYQTWYDHIIERAKFRHLDCYGEWHHIKPKSLGGSDVDENLVHLTYREHFLAHWLLTKICLGKEKRSMHFALLCMAAMDAHDKRTPASWQYDLAKRAVENMHYDEEIRKRYDPNLKAARIEQHNLKVQLKKLEKTRKYLAAQKEIQSNRPLKQNEVIKMSAVARTLPACYRNEVLDDMANDWLKYSPLTSFEKKRSRKSGQLSAN